MDKLELGSTGLRVSPLGLGTVKFGRNQGVRYPAGFAIPDEDSLARLLDLAKSLGINLLDTAPAYGESEARLGRLLRGQRADWVIVSKVGEEFADGESSYHFTPDHFARSLDRTLTRLGTDRLDMLLIHADRTEMAILADDALMRTMAGFKEQGLVDAIGISTKTAAGGIRTLELMDVAMVSYAPDYTDERPVLDYAAKHRKGVILKKILSSGHAPDVPAAIRFAFAHPGTGCAIVGSINPDHLRQLATCVDAAVKGRGDAWFANTGGNA